MRKILKKEARIQTVTCFVGTLLIPFLLIFVGLVFSGIGKLGQVAIIVAGFGVFIISIIFGVCIEVKKRSGPFAVAAVPIATACLWVCIFFPFVVLLPVMAVWLNEDRGNLHKVAGSAIGSFFLLIMVSVTCFAVILNQIFKRIDAEKRAKYVALYVRLRLSSIAVRSEAVHVRTVYDLMLVEEEDKVQEQLLKNDHINWWAVPQSDPDLNFEKMLVDEEMHKKLTKKALKMRKLQERAEKRKELQREKIRQKVESLADQVKRHKSVYAA